MASVALSDRLRTLLRGNGPVVFLTGAGVSAESGLATFRGPGGLWRGRDPMDLATPDAFARDPGLVWEFYDWRRAQAAAAAPNAAHRALAELERSIPEFLLVTQNVDGLHERAGSREIVRLHGTLWRVRCVREGTEIEDLRPRLAPLPPRCVCGELLRPAVVWFGEALPEDAFAAAARAARRSALLVVAGTSSLVYPAASLPAIAKSEGAYLVEVNPEATALSPLADEVLRGPAGEIVPLLAEAAGAIREGAR